MTYEEGVEQAYRGELVGERLYRRLAMGRGDERERAKLAAVAEVERSTHRMLEPIAMRLGIGVTADEVAAVVARRAPELAGLSWDAFVARAVRDWPPYIDRFLAVQRLAPPRDAFIARAAVEPRTA